MHLPSFLADCLLPTYRLSALQVVTVVLYLSVHIPAFRTFRALCPSALARARTPSALPSVSLPPPAHPLIGFRKPSPLAVPPALTQTTKGSWTVLPPTPPPEVPYTLLEKTDAVRVLAAGNTLIGIVRPFHAHAAAHRVRITG